MRVNWTYRARLKVLKVMKVMKVMKSGGADSSSAGFNSSIEKYESG